MNLSLAMPTQGVDTECLPRLFGETKGASHGQISDRLADAVARRESKMGPALIERLDRLPQPRLTDSKMVSIDAIAPLDVVIRTIKRALWSIL
jgi:hypothetical protein